MKVTIFKALFILFTLLLFNNCNQRNEIMKIEELIENVRAEFAPDKRVEIFDISVESEGSNFKLTGETTNSAAIDTLVERIAALGFNIKNEVNMLPLKDLGDGIFGIVNISVANIRSKSAHPAELATQSTLGTIVKVLKKEDGWFLIQTPDKYISWVDDDAIFLVDSAGVNTWQNSNRTIVTKPIIYIYDKIGENGKIVSDAVLGSILKIKEYHGNYINVEFPDGRTGYIKKDYCKEFGSWLNSLKREPDDLIETSELFMGLPYLWGGTSSKGVDCSGFTKSVYYMNGILIPRDASQQVNVGKLVDTNDGFDNLRKGDLLFFGRKKTDEHPEKITHVALYMGNNKYIHSAGRVRINSINPEDDDFNKYRFNSFIRAKRILGEYDNGSNLIMNNDFYK